VTLSASRCRSFFAGIPLAIVLVALGLWAGKSFKDLHDVASDAQSSVETTLSKAREDAKSAESHASNALSSSIVSLWAGFPLCDAVCRN
jgi:hypothetical protein